jgi:hypothetical protein
MRNILLLNGKVIRPVFTSAQAHKRAFFRGEDIEGPFVACKLDNRWDAQLYGWYMLVSPEDVDFIKKHSWCGNICGSAGGQHLEVRRREHINGRQFDFLLHHEIWKRMSGVEQKVVFRVGHQLDFRRSNLALPGGQGCIHQKHNAQSL